jgi:uncharacterized membrane protein YgcG
MRSGLVLTAVLCAAAANAQSRQLYWDELSVVARLDADGLLHVAERQTMVFSGDWNGGERQFRLEPWQRLTLHSMTRIDPDTGAERPMVEGDLDEVDHYGWKGSRLLRWRSRLPSDPPFAATRITYLLDYTISGVLRKEGERYLFDHDFAFADRDGSIAVFSVDLEIDPAWRVEGDPEPCCQAYNLAPGRGFQVERVLTREAAGEASAVVTPLPNGPGYVLFGLAAAAMAALYFGFRRAEAARGRFSPPPVPRPLSAEWLQENVFNLKAEVVGALWDGAIGPPEVAAVLARMEKHGKLASEVINKKKWNQTDVLSLRLLVPHQALSGYEAKLISKLFFDGRTETDTDAIRKHYKDSGFQPVEAIQGGLKLKVQRVENRFGESLKVPGRLPLRLFGAVLVLLVAEAVLKPRMTLVLIAITAAALVIPVVAGTVTAHVWSRRVDWGEGRSVFFLVPAVLVWMICGAVAVNPERIFGGLPVLPEWLAVAGLALLPVAILAWILYLARNRDSDGLLHKRQLLAAVRSALQQELSSESPALDDAWMPYLIAFGLHREVDHWFKEFGGASGAGAAVVASSGGSLGGGWTGGGGQFGGAGATASWGAAAAGLASGVAAPGSSSGGGGSSSGGGGGGGW